MRKLALILGLTATMSMGLVGCSSGPEYVDGTYTGTGEGHGGEMEVEVTVAGGKISDVEVLSHNETEGISDAAFEEVPGQIVEANSTEVDGVAGATYTSGGIKEGAAEALEGATE